MNNLDKKTEKKARIWAWAAVFGSVAVAVCVLVFCGLYRPFPPPPEYGLEVNLGYSDVGMGDLQRYDPMAEAERQVSSPASAAEETVLSAADEDAPSLPEVAKDRRQKTVKPESKETEAEEKPQQPELNQMALYPGKRKGSEVSSQGETSLPGDQGKTYGDANAKGYGGSGGSGGISFSLNGRTLTSLVKPEYNSEEDGIVVVRIWVNPAGIVTRVSAGVKGTTTMDQNLWKTAENAARQSRFAPKENAPEEQVGTITYRFVRGL